jgi:hypothetical protein
MPEKWLWDVRKEKQFQYMHVRTEKRTLHGASSAQALASRSSRVCFHASTLDLRPAPRPSGVVGGFGKPSFHLGVRDVSRRVGGGPSISP